MRKSKKYYKCNECKTKKHRRDFSFVESPEVYQGFDPTCKDCIKLHKLRRR
jgi:hypothetical protein